MVSKLPARTWISNLAELEAFTQHLMRYLNDQPPTFFILLTGDLGAGKTTLTQYLLRNLGVKDSVTSPTFVILNQYKSSKNQVINHMDGYRLSKTEDLGMYEELFENSLNIIEWPEKLNFDWTQVPHLALNITRVNHSARLIEVR